MAKGYWIVRVDITDMDQYKNYVAANAAPLAKYGARFLGARRAVRKSRRRKPHPQCGDRVSQLPGGARLLEIARISECDPLRQPVSTADLVIIEGYEGAQPT